MRLGIDAKWYFNGPPSGQVVVRNLIDQIIVQHYSFDLYIFIDKKYEKSALELWGNKVKIIPITARPNLLSNLFFIPFWSWRLKLDVILFQNFTSLLPSKSKSVAYIHDVLFLDYPSFYSLAERIYLRPMSFLAKQAHSIITISQSEKERLIKHRIGTDETIGVVYHGINSNFKPLSEYTVERLALFEVKYQLPPRYLLYVGRINIRKNLLNLVKALPYLKDKTIKLIIVGRVNHKNVDLSVFLKEYNLEDRVHFTGHIPEEDLYLFYARSTVFCFPSYAEGFGLPPLEAMSCGVPVVTSNRTSLPEICGDAAVYVDPDEPTDIATKINALLNDPFVYEQKRQKSLSHSRTFTWSRSASEIIQLLERVA